MDFLLIFSKRDWLNIRTIIPHYEVCVGVMCGGLCGCDGVCGTGVWCVSVVCFFIFVSFCFCFVFLLFFFLFLLLRFLFVCFVPILLGHLQNTSMFVRKYCYMKSCFTFVCCLLLISILVQTCSNPAQTTSGSAQPPIVSFSKMN